jgi:tRNA(fMet)-specific endonuclease VapC
MFLLDTDVYTHLRLGNPRVAGKVRQAAADADKVAVTVITRIEVLRGRMDALLKADDPRRMVSAQQAFLEAEADFGNIDSVLLDDTAVGHFQRLSSQRGMRRVGRPDLLIACIALARDATLVTRNRKHFRLIPGLRLDNWVV